MRWLVSLALLLGVAVRADYFSAEEGEEEELPEPVFVRAGANVSLPCGPTEGPVRSLIWWKEYRKIVEVHDEQTTLWEAEPHINLLSDALFLRNVVYSDSADYQCQINDEQRASIRLLVQDVPDPPGMPLIISFTSRSVNLSWAPSIDNHHSPILHYVIHVRYVFLKFYPCMHIGIALSGDINLPCRIGKSPVQDHIFQRSDV